MPLLVFSPQVSVMYLDYPNNNWYFVFLHMKTEKLSVKQLLSAIPVSYLEALSDSTESDL